MAIGPARMSLMEHLGELRMRLVRIIVCLIVATCVFYLSTGTVVQFLLAPVAEFMPTDGNGDVMLNVLGAFDAFSVRITVALWTALIATAPITLWQILAFFLPALKPRERKWFLPTFVAALALFIIGTVFCYCVILNPAFQWLTDQASGFATILPEAGQWVDIIIKFELGFGIGFPVILLLLLSAIQANIPVSLFEIQRLAPGIAVFGLAFLTLFSATLVARDRETASRMGYEAVMALASGRGNCVIATKDGRIVDLDMEEALQMKKPFPMERYQILEALTLSGSKRD